jgi:FtsP/CotA-like multicopper oxidase with cupredoxin domain
LTEDAHPIHLHLVDMQILNRQAYDADAYQDAYAAAFPGGTYLPGFGPPLDYVRGNPNALGGNPDVGPFLTGAIEPPRPYEQGWKDTIVVPPGMVTRFIVRYAPSNLPLNTTPELLAYPFDPSGAAGYVWHCHILSHEDNEMMRPYQVQLNPAAPEPNERPLQLGRDY